MVRTGILTDYINDVRSVFQSTDNPTEQGEQVARLTAEILTNRGWLEKELDAVERDQFRLTALYTDDDYGHPEPGFRITVGRIAPGEEPARSHVAHDHGLGWVVYGTYTGERQQTIYNWDYDRSGVPHLKESDELIQGKGDVIVVPPGEIHQQATVGNKTSINFRIESQDMSNRRRHWYNVDDDTAEVGVKPTVD